MSTPEASKPLVDGRYGYWKNGVVVVTNPSDPDGGTAFRPDTGRKYYEDLK